MDFSFLFLISMVVFILEQQEDINSYKTEMLPSPTTSMDHRTCNFPHGAAKAATVASERSSFSTVVPGSHANRSPSVNATPQIHHRERRCSCENLKDKECVYFCHIGIVWVDTPSQVIPYGVGSLQMRLRRNAERCQCTDRRDTKCVQFCSYLDLQHVDEKASVRRYHPRNYKERFTLRRPRNHNPIQTT